MPSYLISTTAEEKVLQHITSDNAAFKNRVSFGEYLCFKNINYTVFIPVST